MATTPIEIIVIVFSWRYGDILAPGGRSHNGSFVESVGKVGLVGICDIIGNLRSRKSDTSRQIRQDHRSGCGNVERAFVTPGRSCNARWKLIPRLRPCGPAKRPAGIGSLIPARPAERSLLDGDVQVF